MRRTLLVVLLLLLTGVGGGGAYVYHWWRRSDELLRHAVLEKLQEIAPGWNVSVRRAWFDLDGNVHLADVVVPGDDPAAPILSIPEAVLAVDRETLGGPHPALRGIRIIQPTARLVRARDGAWNVGRLPPLELPRSIVPECRFESGTVHVHCESAEGAAAPPVRLDDVQIEMVPSGKRQFVIRCSAALEGSDGATAEARWNIPDKVWSISGQAAALRIDRRVLELAGAFSADFRQALRRLESHPAIAGEVATGTPAERASSTGPARAPAVDCQLTAGVQFELHSNPVDADSAIDFRVSLDVQGGELSVPHFPYPLREVRGRITGDPRRIEAVEISALSGGARLAVRRAQFDRDASGYSAELELAISDLPLEERLRQLLPDDVRRLYDSIQPTGRVDADFTLARNGAGQWTRRGEIAVRDVTAAHVKFPYRVEQINGTINCQDAEVVFALSGAAQSRPVTLRGRVKNPGPEALALFDIEAASLPIDRKLRDACPPRYRQILDLLGAEGELQGLVRLSRPAEAGAEIIPWVQARLRDGALNCRTFPYPLSEVSGEFEGSGEDWTFRDFRGRQGSAEVRFEGAFTPDEAGVPRLTLQFECAQVPCDRLLRGALPTDWQAIWGELSPGGRLAAAGVVEWTAGAPLQLTFDAALTEGSLLVKSFPYPLDEVQAEFGLRDGVVTVRRFSGRHDETRFRARGSVDFPEADEWHLHLTDLFVDDLQPDRTFRKALNPGLRGVVEAFDPRGKLSISGTLDFRGRQGTDDPVTAAWDTVTVYTGNTISAGVELKDMHGTARFAGTWDGAQVSGEGRIDLNSVRIFDYQLSDIRGPVSIDGNQLIVGSREAVRKAENRVIHNARRLTARFIEGTLGLDAVVQLGEPMRYWARVTLSEGNLRRYAQTYMTSGQRLAGAMNGWVEFDGEGTDPRKLTGTGLLEISRAALYELPIIVAIFNVLSFTPVDTTAFDHARFRFDVGSGLVKFQRIDLVGNAINLVGRGTVRFDGNVTLDFLSTLGRNQLPIPLVRDVVNEVTKGWVGVEVRGPIRNPEARVRTFKQMDEALRRLMGNLLDPRAPARR